MNAALGAEARHWAIAELHKTLRPLRDADKLGYVLFQLAPWIKRSDEALDGLAQLPLALPDTTIAIEFRHRSWFGAATDETLRFLSDHGLTYVSTDGPRSRATVPSLPALTNEDGGLPTPRPQLRGLRQATAGQGPDDR